MLSLEQSDISKYDRDKYKYFENGVWLCAQGERQLCSAKQQVSQTQSRYSQAKSELFIAKGSQELTSKPNFGQLQTGFLLF